MGKQARAIRCKNRTKDHKELNVQEENRANRDNIAERLEKEQEKKETHDEKRPKQEK